MGHEMDNHVGVLIVLISLFLQIIDCSANT